LHRSTYVWRFYQELEQNTRDSLKECPKLRLPIEIKETTNEHNSGFYCTHIQVLNP
jgi:hypothetical protein